MIKKGSVVLISIVCFLGLNSVSAYAKGDHEQAIFSTIYFKNGSAKLEDEFESELKKVEAALKSNAAVGLQIQGYGDSRGSGESNRAISLKRAQAVKEWFLDRDVATDRLLIKNGPVSGAAAESNTSPDTILKPRVEIVKIFLKRPVAFVPAARYDFESVPEGQQVAHHFVIQNKGEALLEVQKVRTD